MSTPPADFSDRHCRRVWKSLGLRWYQPMPHGLLLAAIACLIGIPLATDFVVWALGDRLTPHERFWVHTRSGRVASGVSFACLLLHVWRLRAISRRVLRMRGRLCPWCRYSLDGVVHPDTAFRCPECGRSMTLRQARFVWVAAIRRIERLTLKRMFRSVRRAILTD